MKPLFFSTGKQIFSFKQGFKGGFFGEERNLFFAETPELNPEIDEKCEVIAEIQSRFLNLKDSFEGESSKRQQDLRKQIEENITSEKEIKKGADGVEYSVSIQELIKSAESMKSKLSANHLLMLEFLAPGTLEKMFIEDGKINFHGNTNAEKFIGLGHIFDPTKYPFLKIRDNTGLDAGEEEYGEAGMVDTNSRGWLPGYGDAENGYNYMEIHTGDIILEKYSTKPNNWPESDKGHGAFRRYENDEGEQLTPETIQHERIKSLEKYQEYIVKKNHESKEKFETISAWDLKEMSGNELSNIIGVLENGSKDMSRKIKELLPQNEGVNFGVINNTFGDIIAEYAIDNSEDKNEQILLSALYQIFKYQSEGKTKYFFDENTGKAGVFGLEIKDYGNFDDSPFSEETGAQYMAGKFLALYEKAKERNELDPVKTAIKWYLYGSPFSDSDIREEQKKIIEENNEISDQIFTQAKSSKDGIDLSKAKSRVQEKRKNFIENNEDGFTRLTHKDALKRLNDAEIRTNRQDQKGKTGDKTDPKDTSLDGIKEHTLEGIIALNSILGGIKVTGGTEVGHMGWKYKNSPKSHHNKLTHWEGDKMDIIKANGTMFSKQELINAGFEHRGNKPYPTYWLTQGGFTYRVYYETSPAHLDVAVIPNESTPMEQEKRENIDRDLSFLHGEILNGVKRSLENYQQKNNREYPKDGKVCYVDISDQKMYIVDLGEKTVENKLISSATAGLGTKADSDMTPPGTHIVGQKFGHGAQKGTIFEARKNTGRIADIYTDDTDRKNDVITSRIMWLEGLENSNNNSKSRYVYIHGTNEEGLIGKKASHGCIRMKNDDIIDIFDGIPEGTLVEIGR